MNRKPSIRVRAVASLAFAIVLGTILAGCASDKVADANPPPVNIVSDNYCSLAKKRSWDVDDTQASIDEARTENHKWDCLCTDMRGTPQCKRYSPATS